MNQEQFTSLVRTIIQVGGGIAVGRGWITGEDAVTYGAAILTIAVTIWGLWVRRNTGLVEAAAKVPEVQKIVTDPVTAVKTMSDKIVARQL